MFGLTSTSGACSKGGSRGSGASLQGPGQQNADLVLGVWVQVADLVCGLVHGLQVVHGARHRAVLHLPFNDGAVAIDGVGVELDPQVGGTDRSQLRRGNGDRGLWGNKQNAVIV